MRKISFRGSFHNHETFLHNSQQLYAFPSTLQLEAVFWSIRLVRITISVPSRSQFSIIIPYDITLIILIHSKKLIGVQRFKDSFIASDCEL